MIIKELPNNFLQKFECLRENTEKYKTSSIPTEKEVKNGNENVVTLSYIIKFVDSERFMATLLSKVVDNLREGIHTIKCKDCDCFLQYESVKDNLTR